MNIFLVRHGQTEQNKFKKIQGRKDYPLNEAGIDQAKNASKMISTLNLHFDVIISSPLSRAKQTANIINESLKINTFLIDENLIEREFGDAEGMDIEDKIFAKIIKEEVNNLEKEVEIQSRAFKVLNKLYEIYHTSNVLIVTHSHVIKTLIKYCLKSFSFLDTLDNCSLTHFKYDGQHLELVFFNQKNLSHFFNK